MSGKNEFKLGWKVVLASAIGIGLGMSPLPFYTLGVFVGPYIQEFQWGAGQIFYAFSVMSIVAFFAAPSVGYVADRIGVRKTVIISIILFGLTIMSFALQTGSYIVYLTIWGLLAFVGCGTLPITFTRTINKWFKQKRGLALGISLLFTGLFGAGAKLFANYMIQTYDWRTAYIALGLLPIVIALPLVLLFFKEPTAAQQIQLDIDNGETDMPKDGLSLGEALRDKKFWLLVASFLPISFAVGGPIPNLENFFQSVGFTLQNAVEIAALMAIPVVLGRLIGGYLMDKLWAPGVAFAFFIIPVIACYIFQGESLTYTQAVIGVMILGFAAGVEYDLMAYIVSRYFGLKNYSAIYGAIYGFFAIGAGFGPGIFGSSFEATGSYSTIFGYTMIAFIVGAIPLLFLGKYRYD